MEFVLGVFVGAAVFASIQYALRHTHSAKFYDVDGRKLVEVAHHAKMREVR